MLFESKQLRITAEHGTATLWLGIPGEMVNALDLARLRELDEAFRAVAEVPSVQILVIRSANPRGFCAGVRPDVLVGLATPADRAAFAWYGQQVFERLAKLNAVTIAAIDGPCLGAGLELALACDYRLCVARATTHLGFPGRIACFGGSARLRKLIGRRAEHLIRSGQTLSGREAWKLKLVDLAYCERRAKIELRGFLDDLELRPLKRHAPDDLAGLASERRAFAAFEPPATSPSPGVASLNPIPPFPETVGFFGDDVEATRFASEVAMRGGMVVMNGNRSLVDVGIDAVQKRGFITPLEAEQARQRVQTSETLSEFRKAGLVFVASDCNVFRLATVVLPRAMVFLVRPNEDNPSKRKPFGRSFAPSWGDLESFPYPRRIVQLSFCGNNRIALGSGAVVDSDAIAALSAWFRSYGRESIHIHTGHISQIRLPMTRGADEVSLHPDVSMGETLTFVPGA